MPFCCLAVQLLGRVFNILRENNPELAGDRRRTVMRPPQVLREGTKKTVFVNFMDLCKTYVFISHITMHYSYQIFIIYNYRLFALQIFFIHCLCYSIQQVSLYDYFIICVMLIELLFAACLQSIV